MRSNRLSPPSRLLITGLALSLLLAGCKSGTLPTAANDGGSKPQTSYAQSCATGALVGAAAGAFVELITKRNQPGKKVDSSTLLKAAAAGCAIGLAATAIGRVMDANQQAKHEEAMQQDARRRALEQQQLAALERRHQAMPAATPAQRQARDASLERARDEWQNNYGKPVTVELGNGGTSTIQAQPPKAAPTAAPGAPASACVDYTVLVRTAAGSAKQLETWCPNDKGQMARVETRDAPAA